MPRILAGFALVLLALSANAACVATALPDVTTFDAQLSSDDCVDSNGAHYDIYTFRGSAGAYVEVTLAPLDMSLTMPSVTLRPPRGDASVTPFVGGAGTLRFRFVLTSAGDWTLVAGTLRAADAGRYRLTLRCQQAAVIPADQTLCMTQALSCGQIAHWVVGPSICRFSNHGLYANYILSANAG